MHEVKKLTALAMLAAEAEESKNMTLWNKIVG